MLAILLAYLAAATVYLLVLAGGYFLRPQKKKGPGTPVNRFAVLVPAHNEECLVERLCRSLLEIDYPQEKYEIFVVADNCSDRTVENCSRYPVRILERNEPDRRGKGYALDWGLQAVDLAEFDGVFIVDADNIVDPGILKALNRHLNLGEQALQCYNAVGNREDSWFTQLLFVSRVIGNQLYHEAKYRFGWSSYLMGNGLCFKADLLQKRGWTAYSCGEDWEYYAQLIEDGIPIGFAVDAKVFHQESRSLNQATSQRLRWSSGRFAVARTLGWRLLVKGLKEKNWQVFDASLPLLLPNYSLQVNLTLLGVVGALVSPPSPVKIYFVASFVFLLVGQCLLFLTGTLIAGSPGKVLRAALYAPLFLVWKSVIDLLCLTGLYRNKEWIRTSRH